MTTNSYLHALIQATELDFDKDVYVNVFETTIRALGGLLGIYYLTNDQVYLDKAVDLGDRLLPAFNTTTGIPLSDVNLRTHHAQRPTAGPRKSSTAETTTVQLELKYLSYLTGNDKYAQAGDRVLLNFDILRRDHDGSATTEPVSVGEETTRMKENSQAVSAGDESLRESCDEWEIDEWDIDDVFQESSDYDNSHNELAREEAHIDDLEQCAAGDDKNRHDDRDYREYLVPIYIDPETGAFSGPITLGARGDSYYEYLLKHYIMTKQQDPWLLQQYLNSISGIHANLIQLSHPSNYTYVSELINGELSPKMDHLVCFLPGTLLLGTTVLADEDITAKHKDTAGKLLSTCVQMYLSSPAGLAPEIVIFTTADHEKLEDMSVKEADAHNLLRPETVESLFYYARVHGKSTERRFEVTIG